MDWILKNKEWLFSGFGVFVISIVVAVIKHFWLKKNKTKEKSGNEVNQSLGTHIKSKGDVKIKGNKQGINF